MDGEREHNRVVSIGLCGGNKEGTGQESLAATPYIDTAVVGLRNVVILTKVKNTKTFFLRMWKRVR